ncbi:MAG: helix-turn-helix domain-containing protein [Planctomycetes bacterium]|nr:helix-turn-helix domain-containing protein [Planctomycetota bacterium]
MSADSEKRISSLQKEILLSPGEVRRKCADRLEAFLESMDTDAEYAFEFIYYRITGFRSDELPVESWSGREIRPHLLRMLNRISDSAPTAAEDVPEKLLTVEEIASRYDVSKRTVYRWRQRGLISRKYRFSDGRVRTAVRESALLDFVEKRQDEIEQSSQFARLDAEERDKIVGMARNFAGESGISMTAAARQIARDLGRATETVRQVLHKYQEDNPEAAFFQSRKEPLSQSEKERILNSYRKGQSVERLAERFCRSRSSIYRIINETRAQELLESTGVSEGYIDEDLFGVENAEEKIVDEARKNGLNARFRLYNYLKFSFRKLKGKIDTNRYVPSGLLDKIQIRRDAILALRSELATGQLATVVIVARQHSGPLAPLADLLAEGYRCMLDAADEFDYRSGKEFGPFGRIRLLKMFARTVPQQNFNSRVAADSSTGQRPKTPREMLEPLAETMVSTRPLLSAAAKERLTADFGVSLTRLPEVLIEVARQLDLSEAQAQKTANWALGRAGE